MAPGRLSNIFSRPSEAGTSGSSPNTDSHFLSTTSTKDNASHPHPTRPTLSSIKKQLRASVITSSFSSSSSTSSYTAATSSSTSTSEGSSVPPQDGIPRPSSVASFNLPFSRKSALSASLPASSSSHRLSFRPSATTTSGTAGQGDNAKPAANASNGRPLLWGHRSLSSPSVGKKISKTGLKVARSAANTPVQHEGSEMTTGTSMSDMFVGVQEQLPEQEVEDNLNASGTRMAVTTASLRRTLSRISLNAPTLRRDRTNTHSSSRVSSPYLGSTTTGAFSNTSTISKGKDSPRLPQYRLPRLKSFSVSLRLDLKDGSMDRDDEHHETTQYLEADKTITSRASSDICSGSSSSITVNHACVPASCRRSSSSTRSHRPPSSKDSSSTSPRTKFGFESETRYVELANLISILEASPPQYSPRSSSKDETRITTSTVTAEANSLVEHPTAPGGTPPPCSPSSPRLLSKIRSISKLRIITSSPVLSSTTLVPNVTEEDPSRLSVHVLPRELGSAQQQLQPEQRSNSRSGSACSFPYPSIRPSSPTDPRLKASKSLNDLIASCTGITASTQASLDPFNSYTRRSYNSSMDDFIIRYEPSFTSELDYPGLCTPPRTPRSRHATVEWFPDFVDEDAAHGIDGPAQDVAVEESYLLPSYFTQAYFEHLGQVAERVKQGDVAQYDELGEETGEGEAEQQADESLNRHSEVYDSLMEIIDSFPSPTIITSSPALSSRSASSPPSAWGPASQSAHSSPISSSTWSLQTPTYSPTDISITTPASHAATNTPASSYFAGETSSVEEAKHTYNQIRRGDIPSQNLALADPVSSDIQASHKALAEVLNLA